jgi:hypothetical protein
MTEQISPNERRVPAHLPPSPERVVNVEIDELIFDGFGPLDSPPANSRRPNSRPPGRPETARLNSARLNSDRAAEAFRRELVRELGGAMTGPAAEELAGTIADAVFRQLAAPHQRRGPRPMGGSR